MQKRDWMKAKWGVEMIRAIVSDGKIEPIDPLPEDWADGQELQVDLLDDKDRSEALGSWIARVRLHGGAEYESGERERLDQLMEQADREAKEFVRRQMGLS